MSAVVVAQLVDRSLLILEIHGSNPVIGKFLKKSLNCILSLACFVCHCAALLFNLNTISLSLSLSLSLSFSYYTSSFCLQNISTTYCPAVKSFHAFDLFSSPPQSICLPVFCNLSFYPVSTILDSLISTTLP